MPRILLVLVGLWFLLSVPCTVGLSHAQTQVADNKTSLIQTQKPPARLNAHDLSSVIIPPSSPYVLVGTAGGWLPIYVNTTVTPPVIANSPNSVNISWSGTPASTATPKTCTWTISSAPPGPAWIYLTLSGGTPSDKMNIDSLTGVVDLAAHSNWIPTSLTTTTKVTLEANGLIPPWGSVVYYKDGDDDKPVTNYAEPYSSLVWYPASVTLVYQ